MRFYPKSLRGRIRVPVRCPETSPESPTFPQWFGILRRTLFTFKIGPDEEFHSEGEQQPIDLQSRGGAFERKYTCALTKRLQIDLMRNAEHATRLSLIIPYLVRSSMATDMQFSLHVTCFPSKAAARPAPTMPERARSPKPQADFPATTSQEQRNCLLCQRRLRAPP